MNRSRRFIHCRLFARLSFDSPTGSLFIPSSAVPSSFFLLHHNKFSSKHILSLSSSPLSSKTLHPKPDLIIAPAVIPPREFRCKLRNFRPSQVTYHSVFPSTRLTHRLRFSSPTKPTLAKSLSVCASFSAVSLH